MRKNGFCQDRASEQGSIICFSVSVCLALSKPFLHVLLRRLVEARGMMGCRPCFYLYVLSCLTARDAYLSQVERMFKKEGSVICQEVGRALKRIVVETFVEVEKPKRKLGVCRTRYNSIPPGVYQATRSVVELLICLAESVATATVVGD